MGHCHRVLLVLFFFFLSPISSLLYASPFTEPFFVTIEKVELESASGEWIKVIEPDRKVDLLTEEPEVHFFNNGRVAPGSYTNVRVQLRLDDHPHPSFFSRKTDYDPPVAINKGDFIGVRFYFDFSSGKRLLDESTVYKVRLIVGEDERVDVGSAMKHTKTREE